MAAAADTAPSSSLQPPAREWTVREARPWQGLPHNLASVTEPGNLGSLSQRAAHPDTSSEGHRRLWGLSSHDLSRALAAVGVPHFTDEQGHRRLCRSLLPRPAPASVLLQAAPGGPHAPSPLQAKWAAGASSRQRGGLHPPTVALDHLNPETWRVIKHQDKLLTGRPRASRSVSGP